MILPRSIGMAFLAGALFSLVFAISAAAADVAELVNECAHCHGKNGASTDPDVPIIGGFSAPTINDAMLAYKEEERPCPETEYRSGDKKGQKTTMCEVADDLDEDEIDEVANYYASKPFVRAKQKFDPALAEKGKQVQEEHCTKCHSEGGSLASDDAGILAGQWTPYLREAFKDFSSGDRPMTKKMKKKYKKLEDDDIEALLQYFASFQ